MKAGLFAIACLLAVVQCSVMPTLRRIPRESFVKQSKANPEELHTLVFAVQQKNLDSLEKSLLERSTPGSALYQKWLTYDEVSAITENHAGSKAVVDWLNQQSAKVVWTSHRSDYIKAEAPVSVWESLLSAEFHEFVDHSRKTPYKSNTAKLLRSDAYTIPAELKEHVFTVFHTVQTPPEMRKTYHGVDENAFLKRDPSSFRSDITVSRSRGKNSKKTSAATGQVTVEFLNDYYMISTNTGSNAQQQSVFQTNQQMFSPNDLSAFQQEYNLPQQPALEPYGFSTTDCVNNDCYEGNLDLQYIMGVSQQTATVYWYQTNTGTSDPFVDWITDVADSTDPPLVNSISWGSIEQANTADVLDAFNTEAMKLGAMGVTVTVSSGDDGVAADPKYCNYDSSSLTYSNMEWTGTPWTGKGYFPSFPATSPYVTTLGATQGPEKGETEVACEADNGGVITTGGGFSAHFPTPTWQKAAVDAYFAGLSSANKPTSGYNKNGRGIPDVSMIGVWYQTMIQGELASLFGTSASSPVFAAMLSLINAARAADNKPPVGFVNPTLYTYGAENTFGEGGANLPFYNDIVEGDNKCTAGTPLVCCNSGFFTTSGWDPVTGWGSIFYPNLGIMFGLDYTYVPPAVDSASGAASSQAVVSGAAALLAVGVSALALFV